jgi:hypothetical protein
MTVGIITGNVQAMGVASVTINPASVAANTTAEQTFTVLGLRTSDAVFVSKPTLSAGLGIVNARCSASDTLALSFVNATASPIDAGSETYQVMWIRPESTPGGVVA